MASEALSRPSAGGGTAERKERTMDGNFTIGRLGGVEVRLHWSLLAVFALIVWTLADGVFPSQNPGLSDGAYLGAAIVAALLYLAFDPAPRARTLVGGPPRGDRGRLDHPLDLRRRGAVQ
jgi:hypothetical protein